MMISNPGCRKFSGYKPCEPFRSCPCEEAESYGKRILIINLDYIGDVLMTTALLPAIHRTLGRSSVHWLTKSNAVPVLLHNPHLYRIWEWNDENRMILESMRFDYLLNADKNINSAAFSMRVQARKKRGFGLHRNGCIVPLNREAEYNYRMGLDDKLKFRENRRTGLDILAQTWKLNYKRDEYVLVLTEEEKIICDDMRREYGIEDGDVCVGLNTGCSAQYPLKKLSVEHHVMLINRILDTLRGTKVLLLGGREDTERNTEIAGRVDRDLIVTPTTEGLRRGILYVNLCDIVISGDTLGMHIGIGLKKSVIGWFSISCAAEIDLFGRGKKIITDLDCAPCWKRSCENPLCVEQPDLDGIFDAVASETRTLLQAKEEPMDD